MNSLDQLRSGNREKQKNEIKSRIPSYYIEQYSYVLSTLTFSAMNRNDDVPYLDKIYKKHITRCARDIKILKEQIFKEKEYLDTLMNMRIKRRLFIHSD